MGTIESDDRGYVYRQADGEITARFDNIDEKQELSHPGDRRYRWVFSLLVGLGTGYLIVLYFLFGR